MYSENIVVGAGTEYPLKGLILLPDDLSKPVPAVVMVHGSGPSNMDEKVMKLTPFKDLAEGLAEHGIASLRYDKRTFVHGRRMMKNKCLTVKEETIDDALLAVRMLKRDPRIDHDRIYILGHSMGAMLAPRIDAEGADVRGLIMMAGTPYRLEEIVLRQLRQAGRGRSILSAIVRLEYRIYRKRFRGLYQRNDLFFALCVDSPCRYQRNVADCLSVDIILDVTYLLSFEQRSRDYRIESYIRRYLC